MLLDRPIPKALFLEKSAGKRLEAKRNALDVPFASLRRTFGHLLILPDGRGTM